MVVLEATAVEEDPEKGPSNDSLESSDSSLVSSKQGRSGPYAAGGFSWHRRLPVSGVEGSSRWMPLEPSPRPRF